MKNNLFSLFRDHREKNVFKRTQRRLTIGFSGQIMFFLFLFIAVVFTVLYIVIIHDQESELRSTTRQEAKLIEKYMVRNNLGARDEQLVLAGVDQFFYYVVSPSGELLLGDENFPQLRSKLLSIVWSSRLEHQDIYQEKLQINSDKIVQKEERRDGYELQFSPSQDEIRLLIAKEPIIFKDHVIGTLYVGKNISFVYQLFNRLLVILIGLAIVFFGVALFISNRMSKKAMIPISKAFDRQREFVADASHELRTPLSVIYSSIDAIEMTIDLEKDDFVQKLLFNMKDEVKRMTNLVSDLLTLARSDSGKIEMKKDIFDFTPIAEKVVQSVDSLAIRKKIHLRFDAPETLVGQGDQEKLTQLLYILLDNAIKYTPNGGEVGLTLSDIQDELCIKVHDTGIGIKPEEQQLIFERFYRSDKSRSRQMGSYGLGLSIAKWIVDIHDGSIQVESEIGKGSTFTIKIPFYMKSDKKA